MEEQAVIDLAKVAATKQSYETDALMCQYLALVSGQRGDLQAVEGSRQRLAAGVCEGGRMPPPPPARPRRALRASGSAGLGPYVQRTCAGISWGRGNQQKGRRL